MPAQGTHAGYKTVTAAELIPSKYLLVKMGKEPGEVELCQTADCPAGVGTDEAAIGEPMALKILGASPQTSLLTASGIIDAGAFLYAAADGKVQGEPNAAGIYWLIGRALTNSVRDGDRLEAETCVPIKVVVIAALKCSDYFTADDIRSISKALSSPAQLKILGN